MKGRRGYQCIITKPCMKCENIYHGSNYKNGTGNVCKLCRREKTIARAKKNRDKINPYVLQEKMKMYRETKYNIEHLKPDENKKVTLVSWNLSIAHQIDYDEALSLIQKGEAQVYSENTIYHLNGAARYDYLKKIVLRRDNNKCYFCRGYGDTIDHIEPVSKGGLNILENMVCACIKCNSFKGNDKSIEETVIGAYTTDQHKEIKKKEFEKKGTLDDMLNSVLNKKKKWE